MARLHPLQNELLAIALEEQAAREQDPNVYGDWIELISALRDQYPSVQLSNTLAYVERVFAQREES